MLEREFEILIRTLPRAFLPSGWVLIAQQLSLPSGRLDMLYSDKTGVRHVVELKKGKAPKSAIEQVLSYANDLRSQGKKACVVPWIIANEISKATENYAHENKVRTLIGEGSPLNLVTEPLQIERWSISEPHTFHVEEDSVYSFYLIAGEAQVGDQTADADSFIIADDIREVVFLPHQTLDLFVIKGPQETKYPTYAQRMLASN